jgi:hypothetical protein
MEGRVGIAFEVTIGHYFYNFSFYKKYLYQKSCNSTSVILACSLSQPFHRTIIANIIHRHTFTVDQKRLRPRRAGEID